MAKVCAHIDCGVPTASTGYEYGVDRRLGLLRKHSLSSDKLVLDVGCGVGAYSIAATRRGAGFVVGIDISQRQLKKRLHHRRVSYVKALAEFLPFRKASFHVVLAIEVIEHVSDEEKTLDELHRVSKPHGLMLLTTPNRFHPFETHGMRLFSQTIGNFYGIGIPFLSWAPKQLRRHLERARIFSAKELVEKIMVSRFRILRIDWMTPLDIVARPVLKATLKKLLHTLELTPVKWLSRHVAITAEALEAKS